MIKQSAHTEPVPEIERTLVQIVLFVRILGFTWMTLLATGGNRHPLICARRPVSKDARPG